MFWFLFVIVSLLFAGISCEGSGVSITIDISMFTQDIGKDVKILDYGVANKEVLKLAAGVAIPDNLTYAKFSWWTDEADDYREKYEFAIEPMDPTLLMGYLDIPMKGNVPKDQEKWLFNMRCLNKVNDYQKLEIALNLRIWNHEGTREYSGINVKPSKICNHIDYPACTVYPRKSKLTSKKSVTIATIDMYGETDQENDVERVKDVYSKLQDKTTILSIQNAPKNLQELFILNTFNSYPYHIAMPRSNEESKDENGLLILSKYPIILCDYISLGVDEEFNKVYGSVISGIDIGSNRIVFLINNVFPDSDSSYIASLNDYLLKIDNEVNKIIKEFKKNNKEYNVMTIYSGDLGQDSGTFSEETDAYLSLLEMLKAKDLYNTSSDSRVVTDYVNDIRSEFLLTSNNDELYNGEIKVRSVSTFNITSERSSKYQNLEVELATPNSVLTATFEFWPLGNKEDASNSYFEKDLFLLIMLLCLVCL